MDSDKKIQTERVETSVDLLNTLAALGDLVIAQNAALLEASKLIYSEKIAANERAMLIPLNESLLEVKKKSDEYINVLKTHVAHIKAESERLGDA
ncbi:hypothetical protein [Pseudomonas sp. PNPG3]|uniref:hypothetical protein n=1 Tax=Pseudomonas sp. PNPG3 TaxID=2919497 RepID=UPI001FFCC034|nr:hypothetical protein [Pseudomonas sp. PNPG3]MCK2123886.1 hypothetical protein [Pseudomonas sp. PNPG3]